MSIDHAKLHGVNKDITVLVVDDYAMTRAMVQSILKGVGFHNVLQAENGAAAIERLEDNEIGLVVCDWNMPDLPGIEVLRYVREEERYRDLPFILLTAEAYRQSVAEAVEAGVSDYVVKPFTADVLLDKIAGALKAKKSS